MIWKENAYRQIPYNQPLFIKYHRQVAGMLIFVYGTLKKGLQNHDIMGNSKFISEAYIHGILYDLGVGFPAVLLEEGKPRNRVYGEIYDVSMDLLENIDEFEGFYPDNEEDSIYLRMETEAYPSSREKIIVQVYLMPSKKLKSFFAFEIKDGKWNR